VVVPLTPTLHSEWNILKSMLDGKVFLCIRVITVIKWLCNTYKKPKHKQDVFGVSISYLEWPKIRLRSSNECKNVLPSFTIFSTASINLLVSTRTTSQP